MSEAKLEYQRTREAAQRLSTVADAAEEAKKQCLSESPELKVLTLVEEE